MRKLRGDLSREAAELTSEEEKKECAIVEISLAIVRSVFPRYVSPLRKGLEGKNTHTHTGRQAQATGPLLRMPSKDSIKNNSAPANRLIQSLLMQ